MIELIAAAARNGVIGAGNRLLWRIPEDFAHFKRTTMGAPVVMGRKTWESIGRPLPGRRNIVISRRGIAVPPKVTVVKSLAEAIALLEGAPRIMVIGGGEIYRQALPLAGRIWLTRIDADYEGDTWFPTIPRGRFRPTLVKTLATTPGRPMHVFFERWDSRS
ncbi:dihydrofolate reductase [Sutterella sp.]|uniref:dihydrofolate reductase n=1 Tax=Sutterella sp. TaxID=1981025 RepID=UPI0026E0058F|nr:dihydrofolate reductase [Sutterella sp.]MDO5531739.1 dihydrofolate reductase [Sutterella sp.]